MTAEICRICAKESCNVLQLFESAQEHFILKIKELTGLLVCPVKCYLRSISGINLKQIRALLLNKLKNRGGMPQNICSSCQNAVNDAHCLRESIRKVQFEFQEMCNKTNLQSMVNASDFLQLDIKEEDELENGVANSYQPVAIYQEEYDYNCGMELKHSDDEDVLKQSDEDYGNATDEEYKDQQNAKEMSSDENSDVNDNAKQERKSKSIKREQYEKNCDDDAIIFVCDYDQCEYIAQTRQRLKDHYQRHIGIKKFSCGYCIKKFHRKSELAKHMAKHTGAKRYKCKFCERRFAYSSTKYHHELSHTNKRPHLCSQCGRAFRASGELKIHMRTHTGERNFRCELCKRSFSQKKNLTRHFNSVMHKEALQKNDDPKFVMPVESSSSTLKTYECKYCQRCFDDSTQKNDHERIHTNERPFLCSQCGKAFRISRLLTLHMRTHTAQRNFKCEICKKCFVKRQELTRHYQSFFHKKSVEKVKESDEIPDHLMENMLVLKRVYKYKCVLCEQSFINRFHLKRHNLSAKHKEAVEKLEKCENTTESLNQLKELLQLQNEQLASTPHFKAEKPETKYKCEICEQIFAQRYRLERHNRTAKHKEAAEKLEKSESLSQLAGWPQYGQLPPIPQLKAEKSENKYKCEICKQSFAQRYHLGRHNLTAKHQEAVEKLEKCETKTEFVSQLAELPQSQNEQLPLTPQLKIEKSENKIESLSQQTELPKSQNEQLPSTQEFADSLYVQSSSKI